MYCLLPFFKSLVYVPVPPEIPSTFFSIHGHPLLSFWPHSQLFYYRRQSDLVRHNLPSVNHILFFHVPGNRVQQDLLYNYSTDWSETDWPVGSQILLLALSEGVCDICLSHIFKNLLQSLLLFKDCAEAYPNAIDHLPQQYSRHSVQPMDRMYMSNLFKWSLIPHTLLQVTVLSLQALPQRFGKLQNRPCQ